MRGRRGGGRGGAGVGVGVGGVGVGVHSCRPPVDPVWGNGVSQVRVRRVQEVMTSEGKGTDFTKRFIFKSKGPTGELVRLRK